ncbi:hypothetical protein NCS55_00606200 [Fusarium keratoplasticum]|nr:hypothetical protein NCS55_00606200 [Fusarium keratoplasticum]
MDTHEYPGQEPTVNPSEVSARSEPIPKGEPTLPTTTPTSSTSRPRRLWSRLESARNRLKALEPSNSPSSSSQPQPQPQPQDDGPSSQGGSLPEDRDASTLNEIIDDEATGNGAADTLPTNEPPTEKQPASETAAHDSPTSGHNEDENKPDARNPPPESSEQGRGADSPPPMSVDKAAEDATKLLGLNFGILLWTLVYRVINLEHLQGFNPDEYDKIQNISVDVGRKLQDTQWHMRRKQQATPAEHSVAQLPEIAEETELPLALKKTAAEAVTALKRSRTSLPMHLQRNGATPAHMWEAAQVFRDFKLAEAIITARLKLTGDTVEEPAADKHAGPTYPWGIFKELEEAAKTTMNYEVSMARPGFDKREGWT